MQIKTTARYHFVSSGVAVIENSENGKCQEDVEELDPHTLLVGL